MKKIHYILIFLLFSNVLFGSQIELSNEEKKYLKTHPNIVLDTDKVWKTLR